MPRGLLSAMHDRAWVMRKKAESLALRVRGAQQPAEYSASKIIWVQNFGQPFDFPKIQDWFDIAGVFYGLDSDNQVISRDGDPVDLPYETTIADLQAAKQATIDSSGYGVGID